MSEKTRVFIETFGCQMNLLDTELVEAHLDREGYALTASADDASVVIYNTCSVRDLSEQKVLSRLGRMAQRKEEEPDLLVGVMGCMAERAGEGLLKKYPQLDLLCGPSELDQIPDLIRKAETARGAKKAVALSGHNNRRSSTYEAAMDRLEALDDMRHQSEVDHTKKAFVRITRGCNKFCSFCVVPMTRGPEVHRPPDAVVDEVRRLAEKGAVEVTLLGQTINHYHFDQGAQQTNFAQLLRRVHDEVPDLPRLRFLTSYPRDFTDEALDVMAGSERICPYLHIPAQSGSDAQLKRMNRGYTRAMYLDLIARARSRMDNLSIVGDMIVGFPGETDADFEASLTLLDEVQYKNVFVFKYSPRPGTVSGKRDADDVPESVKKERNQRMLERQKAISLAHHQGMVDKTFEVLVEGLAKVDPHGPGAPTATAGAARDATGQPLVMLSKKRAAAHRRLTARTRGDHIVAFDGPEDLIGNLVQVRVDRATGLSLQGVLAP
jgi:tRNA-2-methylthio-N6-dimethylallyladenosine synthase